MTVRVKEGDRARLRGRACVVVAVREMPGRDAVVRPHALVHVVGEGPEVCATEELTGVEAFDRRARASGSPAPARGRRRRWAEFA